MLAEDSCHQALRCWQTAYPYPDAEQDGRRDRRPQRTDFQLRAFSLLSPGFRAVHPVNGHSPQECTEVTAHLFQSLRFDSTHHIPTYRNWLHAQGHKAAYRFHRRFLQHLQYQSGRQRWVLKSPDHVFALDALKLAYPDARIVFLHRDPAKVLSSVAHLTEILRKPFTRSIDPHQIGKQVATDWLRGAQIMIEESRRHHFPSAQVFHLHYLELVADPLSAVERLYKHFGIALTAASRARMAQLVDAEPHGGYGNNTYDGSRHGLAAEDIRHRFRDYVNHFGIVQELDAPRPKSAGPKIGFRFPLKTARHAKF
jgi:hypothetical protein